MIAEGGEGGSKRSCAVGAVGVMDGGGEGKEAAGDQEMEEHGHRFIEFVPQSSILLLELTLPLCINFFQEPSFT